MVEDLESAAERYFNIVSDMCKAKQGGEVRDAAMALGRLQENYPGIITYVIENFKPPHETKRICDGYSYALIMNLLFVEVDERRVIINN